MLFINEHRKLKLCLSLCVCTSASLGFSFYSWVLEASFFKLVVGYESGTCWQFGWSVILPPSFKQDGARNLIYHLLMSAFSNSLRCWYKSEVRRRTGDIGDKLEELSCSLRYCAIDKPSICGHVAIQLLLGSPWPCGLLQGTMPGLGRRSAGAETHCLPLLLSSMFPLFSVLAEYFASSHDLFFSARCCWLSHFGCWRGKPQRKTGLIILRTQGSRSENT